MRDDWKERRETQIKVRVGCAVGACMLLVAGAIFSKLPTVHASNPQQGVQTVASVDYDFDTLADKQSVFSGKAPASEEREKFTRICNNLDRWCTESSALSIDFLHTLKVGDEISVIDMSHSITDNSTGVSRVSTIDGDMWYDFDLRKCYVKPLAENNYYRFDNIDVFARQEILSKSLYSSMLHDIQMLSRQLSRDAYRTSTDVSGNLSVMSNGVLVDAELPSVVDVQDRDNYTLYMLSTDNGLYFHASYTYVSGDFTQEDIWYGIQHNDNSVTFPTEVVESSVVTNRTVSDLLKGGV